MSSPTNIPDMHCQTLNQFTQWVQQAISDLRGDQEVTQKIESFISSNLDWIANKDLRSNATYTQLDMLIQVLPEETQGDLRKKILTQLEKISPQIGQKLPETHSVLALKITTGKLPLKDYFDTKENAIKFIINNKLKFVNLEGFYNLSENDVIEIAQNCPQIHTLLIHNCMITDKAVKEIATLKELTALRLLSYHITDVGLKDIKDMQALEVLDLEMGRKITDDGLKDIKDMKLKALNLKGCRQITENGLKNIKDMKLEALNLTGCIEITDKSL